MFKSDYNVGMNEILKDDETYREINRNPLRKTTDKCNELLKRWKKSGYISEATYFSLLNTDGNLPRAYGLPKIHKANHPLRIIISSIDSPTYFLAKFISNILSKSLTKPFSYVKDSVDLKNRLLKIFIPTNYVLISLDVSSLFTNVPHELVIEGLKRRFHQVVNTNIPETEFIACVKFLLNSTYFTFNNKIYEQVYGTPMGSPISPILADIVMQDLETHCLNNIKFDIPVFFRYVDDILALVPINKIDDIIRVFNAFHPRLKFTHEMENNGCINFLETTIIRSNTSFKFDWFIKPTASGRFIDFASHHPLSQKIASIICLTDKAFYISDKEFLDTNINKILNLFLKNNYPLKFINKHIHKRLTYLNNKPSNNCNENKVEHRISLPFVDKLSQNLGKILHKAGIKTVYKMNNKLNSRIIKRGKDILPKENIKGVVYQLNCGGCDAVYVGETKRRINTRIKEHENNIRLVSATNSVITDHRINSGHDFGWKDFKILNKESNYFKRNIAEMLHIKSNKNCINKQNDTIRLNSIYDKILKYI